MTERELKNLYLETEHGTFTPHYTYDDFIIDENTKEGVYINLVIEKTAQEVYDKWLYDRDNPPTQEPSKMEVLKARVDGLENINAGLLLENAEHQINIQEKEKVNKDQEVANANLLLEIAMLKGAML